MLLKYVLNVCSVPTTLLGSRNAKKKRCSFKELALMGDRDNYKEVRIMTQVSPETREEVRKDFPEECYCLSWVPRDEEQ